MEPEQLSLVRNIMEYVTPGKVGSCTMLTVQLSLDSSPPTQLLSLAVQVTLLVLQVTIAVLEDCK